MRCHNCDSLMDEIDHDQSEHCERVVYECPACGHRRLHLSPCRHGLADPDRTYTSQTGGNRQRHSVWTA